MTRTICMNKEIDLKQSTSTMAIVVASGAKVTCFVTVLFMLAHWSPAITVITTKSEKFFRKKRLPRSCTITFFNCCSCLVFVQRECFPEKLQSPPQNNASNKSCPKKRHNFGKPAFMSNKNRSKGTRHHPETRTFSLVRHRRTQGLCWKFISTSIALLHLYVEVREGFVGKNMEKLCDVIFVGRSY